MRTLLAVVVGVAVLVLSPLAYFWWEDEPRFSYGDAEMRAAVEGMWQLKIGGRRITFTIRQAKAAEQSHAARGLVRSAAACGERSFVRNAGACMDVSWMPLEIAEGDKTVDGMFRVFGMRFVRGELHVEIDGVHVAAELAPDGTVIELETYDLRARRLDARLERVH